MDEVSHLVAHLLFVAVQLFEPHHMAVVGVVGTHLAVLVALIDTGHTGQRHVQHLQHHRTFVGFLRIADTYLACPAFLFAVGVNVDGFAGDRGETYLVVVAGDVTHCVVCAVRGEGCQFVLKDGVHALVAADSLAGGEIDVEVELRIQHAALDITADEFGAAVCLADHPYGASLPAGGYLLT